MSTYILEIPPTKTLEQIEKDVRSEEVGASKFISSSLSFHSGKITNLATFQELPAGTIPKPLHFREAGVSAPANTTSDWAGVMIVAGANTAVATYRDQ